MFYNTYVFFSQHTKPKQNKKKHNKTKATSLRIDTWGAVSTSLPRGNHGWRFTARLQVLRFLCPRFCFGIRCFGFWFLFCLFWNLCFVSKSLCLVFVSRMLWNHLFYVEIRCDGFCFPGFVLKSSVPPCCIGCCWITRQVLLYCSISVVRCLVRQVLLHCLTGVVLLDRCCCIVRQVLVYCSVGALLGVVVLRSRCIARQVLVLLGWCWHTTQQHLWKHIGLSRAKLAKRNLR